MVAGLQLGPSPQVSSPQVSSSQLLSQAAYYSATSGTAWRPP